MRVRHCLLFVVLGFCVPAGLILCGTTPAQEKDKKEKKVGTEKVTLQYRVSKDAFAPSSFVAVIDGGQTLGLKLKWDVPAGKKKEFDALIDRLEKQEINGVEFECRGQWLRRGLELRVTTVPQITANGKQRIKDHER